MQDSATLAALASFPQQLESLFTAFSSQNRHRMPRSWEGIPSEMFTALEQICHVRDIEIDGYQIRLRRLLAETNPTLVSIDSYALRNERRYGDADPAEVLAAFRRARAATVETIRNLTDAQLGRRGVFEGYGPVTVAGLIHFLSSHDQQHIAGMQWLLGKFKSELSN